ncbi:citrulline utilization hydrolase CtlX [Ferruginibacter yonginensis]|uniref:Citrulline utilization hydrolase CtlX n=1 Tax=Ferruginibacter yonginensis TaxID=1310416 RepID=A0ABV8QRW1_9BACT
MQTTDTVAMIRPAAFGFNEQTATNNFFQDSTYKNNKTLHEHAVHQFDVMVELLRANAIEVLVLNDTPVPQKPDAIFPNSWISCNNNVITIFPMMAPIRRIEKRLDIVQAIQEKTGIYNLQDWSIYEEENIFLEGNGSMVIDHQSKLVYASISPRTNEKLVKQYCAQNNYVPITFTSKDEDDNIIHYTSLMMCLGTSFAIICLEAIKKPIERKIILHRLKQSGHEVIDISYEQMNLFAAHILELVNKKGEPILVMSTTAHDAFTLPQIEMLQKHATIITPNISYIEKAAGGSVRSMMSELFY